MRPRGLVGRFGKGGRDRLAQGQQFRPIERLLIAAGRKERRREISREIQRQRHVSRSVHLVVRDVQVRALQIAAVRVDRHLGPVYLLEHAFAHIGQKIGGRVRRGAIEGILLHQPGETWAAQQVVQDAILRVPHSAQCADRLDAPQDLGIDRPSGSGKCVVIEKLHRLQLPGLGNRSKDHAALSHIFLLRVESSHDLRHVIHFQRPLAQHAPVKFGQVVIGLALFGGGGGQQHFGDALQILDPERGGLHGVRIAHGLSQLAGVRTS